jgi:hypothetical protein
LFWQIGVTTGTAGQSYTVQASANLVKWVDRTNLVAGTGGLIERLMGVETSAHTCYYHLRWP